MFEMGLHDPFEHLKHKLVKRKARSQIDNLTSDH
jgi:hypothetical protein